SLDLGGFLRTPPSPSLAFTLVGAAHPSRLRREPPRPVASRRTSLQMQTRYAEPSTLFSCVVLVASEAETVSLDSAKTSRSPYGDGGEARNAQHSEGSGAPT